MSRRARVFTFASLLALLAGSASAGDETLFFYPSRNPMPSAPYRSGHRHAVNEMTSLFGGYVRKIPLAKAHRRWIQEYIRGSLKKDLIRFLQSESWAAFQETARVSWAPLSRIPLADFIQDIQNSEYRFEKCRDFEGSLKEGSAEIHARGGAICFDPARILQADDGQWETEDTQARILALAVHEHLHHFGYWDADNRIYRQFTDVIYNEIARQLPSPSRIQVTSRFKALRQEHRDGRMPTLSRNSAGLRCEGAFRELFSEEAPAAPLLARLQEWLGSGVRISRLPGGTQLRVSNGPVKSFARDAWPHVIMTLDDPDLGVWLMGSLGTYDRWMKDPLAAGVGGGRMGLGHSLVFVGTSPAEGRLILEVSHQVPQDQAWPDLILPPNRVTKGSALGYLDCTWVD